METIVELYLYPLIDDVYGKEKVERFEGIRDYETFRTSGFDYIPNKGDSINILSFIDFEPFKHKDDLIDKELDLIEDWSEGNGCSIWLIEYRFKHITIWVELNN